MINYWKCYRVFLTSRLLKCVMYLLYPLFMLLWGSLMVFAFGSAAVGTIDNIGLVMVSGMIVWVELILDYFVYGGIMAKNTNKLEYLKTSKKGITVLGKSLIVDKLRRLVTISLIIGIIVWVFRDTASIWQMMGMILATDVMIELALLLTRRLDSINWIMVISVVANVLGAMAGMLVMNFAVGCTVICLILLVLVGVAGTKMILKKMERSYYDEGVEKVC